KEDEWRAQSNLRGEEFCKESEVDVAVADAPELEEKGGPMVFGVPKQIGKKKDECDEYACVDPRGHQPSPSARIGDHPGECTRGEKHGCELRQKREPSGNACGNPPKAVRGLAYANDRIEERCRRK